MKVRNRLLKTICITIALWLPTSTVCAQAVFSVHVDTLLVKENGIQEVLCNGYTLHLHFRNNCFWSNPNPSVLFEDDLYTVTGANHGNVIFTEKEPTWYIDTHNGWIQHEQINRQYLFRGEFHQMLRHNDYYFFINSNGVDSMRIDQSPGNALVKNILPDMSDNNLWPYRENDKWCDPISGYGGNGWLNPTFCCFGSGSFYIRSKTMPGDTTYRGAFIAEDQLFYVINYEKETFIAQRKGNALIKVLDLGCSWYFYESYGGPFQWWIPSNDNSLQLTFHAADGTAGLLSCEGSNINIKYFVVEP